MLIMRPGDKIVEGVLIDSEHANTPLNEWF